ncbi:MAG: 30S ribosomal protein S16 [Candidatus Nomurabacteria bacterium]|jgi:small subunit ribosomal protein S16|nr:30S ribosomal protein S16 [Candidatus Nomurabacteria bacterium]
MLAIRLQRNGRSGYAVYRIIVQEASRHPLSGRVVAELGSYNPHTKATTLKKELVEKFLSTGAQPSSRVAFLLAKEGVKLPKWVKLAPQKQSAIKKADKLRKNQPKEEPVTEEPTEEVATEAPTEA